MKKLMIPAIVALMSAGALAQDAKPAAASAAAPAPAAAEAAKPAAAADAAKPAEGAAAAAGDCKVVLKADDAMKFDLKEFKINKTACPEFTVEIDHVGKLPAAAMGHNVVITKEADVDAAAKDGIAAGPASNYVKEGDPLVIAHTKLVGGGEKADVTFKTEGFETGGAYAFFCSFPGHYAVMRGKVIVE